MKKMLLRLLTFSLSAVLGPASMVRASEPTLQPFKIDLLDRVPHMLDLVQKIQLPALEVSAAHASQNLSVSTGIDLETLSSLREAWLTNFDWKTEQDSMNS